MWGECGVGVAWCAFVRMPRRGRARIPASADLCLSLLFVEAATDAFKHSDGHGPRFCSWSPSHSLSLLWQHWSLRLLVLLNIFVAENAPSFRLVSLIIKESTQCLIPDSGGLTTAGCNKTRLARTHPHLLPHIPTFAMGHIRSHVKHQTRTGTASTSSALPTVLL